MMDLLKGLPNWVGSVPQWGMFILLLIAVVRTSPQWLGVWSNMKLQASNRVATRITELESNLREAHRDYDEKIQKCRDDCDKQTKFLQDEIGDLEDAIAGMRKQHIQEQISLINTIIESVDAPQLKLFLRTLETVQRNLPVQEVPPTEEQKP